MADRRSQIILLLGSRFDFTFEPETFTGKVVRRSAIRGEAPSAWIPCRDCNATGQKRDRGIAHTCPVCNGRGRVKGDGYTGQPVATADTDPTLVDLIRRDTKTVKCPDCQTIAGEPTGQIRGGRCRRCDGTGHAPVAGSWLSLPSVDTERLGGDGESAMLNAIVRRDHAGSYRPLEEALAGFYTHRNKPDRFLSLTVHAVRARRLLDELYLPPADRGEADLDAFEASLVELALAYIDARMPDPIVVPAAVVANARMRRHQLSQVNGRHTDPKALEARNRQIRRWAREGKPYTWIGRQVGLRDRQLREIINGTEVL